MDTLSTDLISVEKYMADASLELGKKIYSHSPPIYSSINSKNNRVNKSWPMPVASSVLFTIHERFFLVTAAHVFKKHKIDSLGLFDNHDLYYLVGEAKLTNPKLIDSDKIDIAIIELDKRFVSNLPTSFTFFNLNNFNPDHPQYADGRYLIVGSPLTRHKLSPPEKKIVNHPFIFLTHPIDSDSVFRGLGFECNSHLLLDYSRRKIQNSSSREFQMGPFPRGLSGCGIWVIPAFASLNNELSYYPSSILIEYDNNYRSIISTRMRVVTEILRQAFDVDLLKTNLINFNLENTNSFDPTNFGNNT